MVLAEVCGRAEVGKAEEAVPSLVTHHTLRVSSLSGSQPGHPFHGLPSSLPLSPFFFSASPSSVPSFCVPLSLFISRILTSCLSLSLSVATVNDLACRGLDKLEEKLPFLQQPSEMVWHRSWGSAGGGSGREEGCLPQDPARTPLPAVLWDQIRLWSTQKNTTQRKIISVQPWLM